MKPRVFLFAVASGVLLWAAFFPLNLGPVAFIALVPWLVLVRAPVSNRWRYFAAYLGGVTFFVLATQWVRVAHQMMYLSWLGLTVVMPLFWLVALDFIRRLDRLGVPLALAVPTGWVALEYCRMHFPTGFTFLKPLGAYQMIGFGWYFLGYTQHAFAQLIQIADVGGVYAVSFVVAAVNGAVADVTTRAKAVRRLFRWEEPVEPCCARKLALEGAIAVTLFAASIGYGFHRLQHEPFAEGPRVAAIQGNFEQGDKMSDPRRLIQSYSELHQRAFDEHPELIIWPETCCPVDWCEITPGAKAGGMPADFKRDWMRAQREFLERGWNTYVLFGLNGLEWDGERQWKYNSAFLVKPLPKSELWAPGDPVIHQSAAAGRYDKMHLVPFGEYVPLGDELPFMKAFTPYKHDYSCRPGEKWTRFPIKAKNGRDYTFACLICYEDSDTYLARQYVATEPVNFFVNISNDGWFDGTEEHEQHLAICRFRAIEARRAVIRGVNMGISAVIDPDGRVVALPRAVTREPGNITANDKLKLSDQPQRGWGESKKMEGIVLATVPLDDRGSLYATLGDWIPAGCWLAALVGVVIAFVRRRSSPSPLAGEGGEALRAG